MQAIYRRIGYFLKETTGTGKGSTGMFMIRYFLIDNHMNIYYTDNYAQLVHIIRNSDRLIDAFTNAENQLKKLKAMDIKVGKIEKYKNPEILTFLNQLYFEVTLTVANEHSDQSTLNTTHGRDEPKKFLFFTFKDSHLTLLHRFLSGQDKQLANEEQNIIIRTDQRIDVPLQSRSLSENSKLAGLQEHLQKLKGIMNMVEQAETEKSDATPSQSEVKDNSKNGVEENEGEKNDDSKPEQDNVDEKQTNKEEEGNQEEQAQKEESNETIATTKNESLQPTPDASPDNSQPNKPADQSSALHNAGSTYSGPTKDGLAEGKGTEYFSDDSLSYVGEFRKGKRHGLGYFLLKDQGMCYVECINGKISGI